MYCCTNQNPCSLMSFFRNCDDEGYYYSPFQNERESGEGKRKVGGREEGREGI